MAKILVVEDDPQMQWVLRRHLVKWGHCVHMEERICAAWEFLAANQDTRLVLLDRILRDGDGMSLCQRLKKNPATRALPVIVLTALVQFEEELKTYKGGADLYLTKPVEFAKLREYVKTMLDRYPYRGEKAGILRYGVLSLDPNDRSVRAGESAPRRLPRTLFDLLWCLAAAGGKVVSRERLVRAVWKKPLRDKAVDTYVMRLRRSLGAEWARMICTIPGKGYAVASVKPPLSQQEPSLEYPDAE